MTSFKQRMQPVIDAMSDGDDKTKLQVLVNAQDAVEQPDIHPKERAQALRRLALLEHSNQVPPTYSST
jgi:hypothetical protein